MRPLAVLALGLWLPCACAQFGGPKKPTFTGERKEVPALICDVCAATVEAAHAQVADRRAEAGGKALGEESITEVLEGLCDPSMEGGHYLRRLDIVGDERRSRTLLKLKAMEDVSKCEVECQTLALACHKVMDEALDVEDLLVALYKDQKAPATLVQELCKDAEACDGAPVALPKGYERRDFPFVPMEEADLTMETMMARMNAMGYGDQLNMMTPDDMDMMGGMGGMDGMDGMGDFGDMGGMGDFGGMGGMGGMGGGAGFGQEEAQGGYYGDL